MALSFNLLLMVALLAWVALALLTATGSRRRGEPVGRAGIYGFVFPFTWVMWLVVDNHRAGRSAFRSR